MASRVSQISRVVWGILTADEIIKMSVCEVTRPSQRNSLGGDLTGTPYDRRMGVLESGYNCETCGQDNKSCQGHFGHINLPIPVYNLIYIDYILKILQCVCPLCARCRITLEHLSLLGVRGNGFSKLKAIASRCEKVPVCPYEDCGRPLPTFACQDGERIFRTFSGTTSIEFGAGEALNVFYRISNDMCKLLGFSSSLPEGDLFTDPNHLTFQKTHTLQFRPESMIFTAFPVVPPAVRPYIIQHGTHCEDDLTGKYNAIVKACEKLKENKPTKRKVDPLNEVNRKKVEVEIATHVQTLIHNKGEKSKISVGGRPHKCLFERQTGKEGRYNLNIRGKRVDFTARTVVIGAGTLCRADEIGVPRHIIETLTVPEKVSERNIEWCQNLVSAKKVNKVIRRGQIRNLSAMPDHGCKIKLMVGDIIAHHIPDGEDLLMNRQPSLRKESMLSLKVVAIDGSAWRFPVCMTTAFNADFDGDELNCHLGQSIGARVEAAILYRASAHLITPQRNGPVNGLVQDGLIGAYCMTNVWKDTDRCYYLSPKTFFYVVKSSRIPHSRITSLFERAIKYYPDYIIFENGEYKLCDGEIPGTLLLSIVFPIDFDYKKATHTNDRYPIARIKEGIIIPNTGPYAHKASGPMCKKAIGARNCSAFDDICKDYGPEVAIEFLTECQFICDYWLYMHGFSIGISDCIITVFDEVSSLMAETYAKIGIILDSCPNGIPDEVNELKINTLLNSTMNVGLKLSKNNMYKGDKNGFNIARDSGAKGSFTNTVQITAFVGQQNVHGKRVMPVITGCTRTLPHFKENDHSAQARGFVASGYARGMNPSEMFFHAMGGRVGIISTAIKTSTSGYIQKRIGRKEEDNKVEWDATIRVGGPTGKIIQFVYGGDGMDPQKLCYAKGVNFPFFCNPVNVAKRINNNVRRTYGLAEGGERHLLPEEIDLVCLYITAGYHNFGGNLPSPLQRVTDNTRDMLAKCLAFVKLYEEAIPEFCEEVMKRYEQAKIQPGDMVGLNSALCLGEPTTQMTLNVFHLAGVKEKDVSLGVPGLDEKLNTTKPDKQKKSTCTIYIKEPRVMELNELVKKGDDVRKYKEERLALMQVIKSKFDEIQVSKLLVNAVMYYEPEDVCEKEHFPPIDIVKYKPYTKKWWAVLDGKVHTKESIKANWWIVRLKFDVQKLYERRLSLMFIANRIESDNPGKVRCVCSPDIDGEMDVYCNYTAVSNRALLNLEGIMDSTIEGGRETYITPSNINYYVCRDILIATLKNTHITGVQGIKETFVREDLAYGELVIDANLTPKSAIVSRKRFIALLSNPIVDNTRTFVDDMWTMKSVLGIQAAKRFIIDSINHIISFDGTYVNPRNIQLLADNMTFTGDITSVRRDGISRELGPIAKIMFEQSVTNSIMASVFTETDKMKSIASSLMFGMSTNGGTGTVDLEPLDV